MNRALSTPGSSIANAASILARCVVGAVFVYTGLAKALHPADFLKMIRQYNTVQDPLLLNSIAAALPWFEIICGALLLTGIAVRGSALVLLAMLLPFSWMVLHRALSMNGSIPFCAIKFDCGCGTGEVPVCRKLFENAVLILLAGWLLAGRGRKLSLRYSLIH